MIESCSHSLKQIGIALVALASAAAAAQPAPVETPASIATAPADDVAPAAPGCELHVWPGERFRARQSGTLTAFGWLGLLADEAVQSDDNVRGRARLAGALDSPSQARLLAALDLAGLLDLPGYRVVGHDVPVAGRAADAQARHAASASPCYAELIVTRIAYRRPAFGAVRSLRVAFLFRDFGDAAAPRWSHDGGGAGELGVWPPQHVNEAELAAAELEAVFRENVGTFARGLREARQRGR